MDVPDTDADRISELYEGVYPLLVRVLYRMTGRSDVAEELAQESFIRYLEHREKVRSEEARYWLLRVAKNLALNQIKRLQREAKAYKKVVAEARRSEPGSDAEMVAKATCQDVQAALQTLPEKLRLALILREYGDFSYKEISRILEVSEANVKVRVFRARERLAVELSKGESPAAFPCVRIGNRMKSVDPLMLGILENRRDEEQ